MAQAGTIIERVKRMRAALPALLCGTVSSRLRLGFGMLLLLMTVAGVISNVQIQRIESDLTQIVDVEEPLEQAVLEMEIQAGETVRAVLNHMLRPDPKHLERVRAAEKSFESFAATFDQLAETESERRLGRRVHRLYSEFKEIGDQLIDQVDQRNAALTALREDVHRITSHVNTTLLGEIDRSDREAATRVEALLSMELDVEIAFAAVEAYLAQRDSALPTERNEAIANFRTTAGSIASYTPQDSFDQLMQMFDTANADGDRVIGLTDQIDQNQALFEADLDALDQCLDVDLQSLILKETMAAAADGRASLRTASHVLCGVLILGLVFGTATGWWASRRIVRSVQKLVQGSEIIRQGNRDHRIEIAEPQDEFGTIAISFNQMVDDLNRYSNELLESQRRDEEARAAAAKRQIDQYATEARTDMLTQLNNRRAFDDELAIHQSSVDSVEDHDAMVMLVDVDHFKKFNDTYGHHAGDAVLQGVARALQDACREQDFVARYGGEEFAIILPGGNLDEVVQIAEKVRAAIEARVFHFDGNACRVTASGGIAALRSDRDSATSIQYADDALYASKNAGRNCIHFYDGTHSIAAAEIESAVN